MDDRTREQLRIAISVTLALVPRHLKRGLAERIIAKSDPAKAEIVRRIVSELDRGFVIEAKPAAPIGPGPHSAWVGDEAEKPGG